MTFGHLYSKICSLATGLPSPETPNRSFSLSRNKKINWKPSSVRSQETECYKRLIYKQFVLSLRSLSLTVSELFAETFHVPL